MICEGDQIVIRSPHSYASRREADSEAKQALDKHAWKWRMNK
jgi:hypothetical protein